MASHKIKLVDEKSEKQLTYDEVVDLMVLCKTQKRLADHLQVNVDTITATKQRDPVFSDAIEAGKRKATQSIVNKLYAIAADGDPNSSNTFGAIKYILNNMEPEEWADKTKQEQETTIKGLNVIIKE